MSSVKWEQERKNDDDAIISNFAPPSAKYTNRNDFFSVATDVLLYYYYTLAAAATDAHWLLKRRPRLLPLVSELPRIFTLILGALLRKQQGLLLTFINIQKSGC